MERLDQLTSKNADIESEIQQIKNVQSGFTNELGTTITNYIEQDTGGTVLKALADTVMAAYVTQKNIGYNGTSIDFPVPITAPNLTLDCPKEGDTCLTVQGLASMKSAKQWIATDTKSTPAPTVQWSIDATGNIYGNYLVATGEANFSSESSPGSCFSIIKDNPNASVYMGSNSSGQDLGRCSGKQQFSSPASGPALIGYWNCSLIDSCCFNTPWGGKPGGLAPPNSNLNIVFSGDTGLNEVGPKYGQPFGTNLCTPGVDQCWVNFGGGGEPVNVSKYVKNGAATGDLQNLLQILPYQYQGVTFDYENDEPGVTLDDWKELNQQFQQAGMKTALTMAKAGTGKDLTFGIDSGNFLAEEIAFDYMIPQLYGGSPMFYTGEYNESWGTASPPFKGYGLTGGGDCTSADSSNINCTPLKAMCQKLNPNTALIPSFGGQPPKGGMDGVKQLIGDKCGAGWDGKSFISWNITDPNSPSGSGGGDNCPGSLAPPDTCGEVTVQEKQGCESIASFYCGSAATSGTSEGMQFLCYDDKPVLDTPYCVDHGGTAAQIRKGDKIKYSCGANGGQADCSCSPPPS